MCFMRSLNDNKLGVYKRISDTGDILQLLRTDALYKDVKIEQLAARLEIQRTRRIKLEELLKQVQGNNMCIS